MWIYFFSNSAEETLEVLLPELLCCCCCCDLRPSESVDAFGLLLFILSSAASVTTKDSNAPN